MTTLAFTNPQVQRLRRLIGRRSFRVSENACVIEGPKVLAEALASGAVVEQVFAVPGTLVPAGLPVFWLEQSVMARVADTVTPQPLMAVVRRPSLSLDVVLEPVRHGGFVLMGVGLSDPGNVGTLIRSAEGAGACGVVLTDDSVDPFAPKTVRASAGAVFHVPVLEHDSWSDALAALRGVGALCFATSSVFDGGQAPESFDLRGGFVLMIGNEAAGLPAEARDAADGLITIPTLGRTESLNAAMAGTVVLFEAARQRRSAG